MHERPNEHIVAVTKQRATRKTDSTLNKERRTLPHQPFIPASTDNVLLAVVGSSNSRLASICLLPRGAEGGEEAGGGRGGAGLRGGSGLQPGQGSRDAPLVRAKSHFRALHQTWPTYDVIVHGDTECDMIVESNKAAEELEMCCNDYTCAEYDNNKHI
ncbi:unnamed protein product [Danaus chrysippus]|uniref:(African queen) hypothetical protein n=1 Tax=Danaus chrysippus TaxID=151541 RepID=A0A8J2R101_9NEOP|nr:unnamed protein product [Danaus chrysippus]